MAILEMGSEFGDARASVDKSLMQSHKQRLSMACCVGGNLHWTHSGTVRRLGAQPDLMLAIHHAFLHDIDPDYDASCGHRTRVSTRQCALPLVASCGHSFCL